MAKVILICGRICCGKTTYARRLCKEQKAVLLSCDELMLSLLDEHLGERHDVYAARAENYLLQKSLELLETGIVVVLDWGPWTRAGRDRLKAFYTERGFACEIHGIHVSEQVWQERIIERNREIDLGQSLAYHVDEGLMAKFRSRYQELASDEIDVWADE